MMMTGMLLFWVLLIFGGIWLVWGLLGNRPRFSTGGNSTAREILNQRFARGEINRAEYDQVLTDLSR
jgi:putative membrane protein